MTGHAERYAANQYRTTHNLDARIALHRFGVSPVPWLSWVLDHLPVRRGQHVLEAGAGTGALWEDADLDGVTLTLTDASAAMCDTLRAGHPTRTVLRCLVNELPFQDMSFDGVVANHMLYHLDEPATGLRELCRVLRPGGWIAAATNGRDHMRELGDIARATGVPLTALTTPISFSRENGPALLADHFTDVREIPYEDELRVPSGQPVLDYLTSCADHPLTDAETAALRAAVDAVTRGMFRVTKDTVLLVARR